MRSLPFACGLAVIVTGCTVEREYAPNDDIASELGNNDLGWQGDGDAQGEFEDDSYGSLPITAGRVRGDIGAVRDFDAPTDYVDSWGDASWTSITLNATDELGRVGMVILEISNMDLQAAPAGTYNYGALNVNGGDIYVTGCSSTDDSFYDAPAEAGTVVIQDGPEGSREILVEATLPSDTGGTSQASARFTIQ